MAATEIIGSVRLEAIQRDLAHRRSAARAELLPIALYRAALAFIGSPRSKTHRATPGSRARVAREQLSRSSSLPISKAVPASQATMRTRLHKWEKKARTSRTTAQPIGK